MFGRKKESVIDRRLQELQRQLRKLDSDIKSVVRQSKSAVKPSSAAFPPPKATGGSVQPQLGADVANGTAVGPGDLPPQAPDNSLGASQSDRNAGNGLPLFEPRAQIPASGREKFANYFMAGHFANLRAMRPEKRIVRNKAIIMSIAAIIVLIWLFYFLYHQ